jgi:hypothetical protein
MHSAAATGGFLKGIMGPRGETNQSLMEPNDSTSVDDLLTREEIFGEVSIHFWKKYEATKKRTINRPNPKACHFEKTNPLGTFSVFNTVCFK